MKITKEKEMSEQDEERIELDVPCEHHSDKTAAQGDCCGGSCDGIQKADMMDKGSDCQQEQLSDKVASELFEKEEE
jgi:hypothetical protein